MNAQLATTPNFQSDVERLILAFTYIRSLPSPLARFVYLSRIAAYHGLSKSECRKAFEIYCNEFSSESIVGEGGGR